jgi:hypothetical protein
MRFLVGPGLAGKARIGRKSAFASRAHSPNFIEDESL